MPHGFIHLAVIWDPARYLDRSSGADLFDLMDIIRIDVMLVDNSAKIELGEQSESTEVEEKLYSKEDNEPEGDKLDAKIREYMKENKVSYADAFDAISMEEI